MIITLGAKNKLVFVDGSFSRPESTSELFCNGSGAMLLYCHGL